ncbi:MAG: PucR family transcriptional regulator ligand-binding domain-containing protein [Candidatus Nanopelagicales bacterium]
MTESTSATAGAAAIPPPSMPTVGDVLALDPLREGRPRVVAGAAGLDRPVRWTHVSEVLDVARLLSGDELLFTTGIALPDDEDALVRWVDELADVGASGVCVELGRRYDRLPRAMVRTAERRGLPLVELQQECRFVAVTEQVHARIVDAQLALLRASEELHQTFTELSVEGASPAEIVRQTARIAGRPVVLENLAHQVLAYEAVTMSPEDLLVGWEARSRAVRPEGRTGRDPRTGWVVTTVGARGHDWGRLVLLADGPPSSREVMLVERSAATLALNRLVERDRESLERQGHRTLLDGILTHSVPSSDTALRARALGVPLEGRTLVAVVVRLTEVPGEATLESQSRLRDFAELVAAATREASATALVGAVDDSAVGVLLSLARPQDVDLVLDRLSTALERRGRAADVAPFVMAVGSPVDSVRDARRSFQEAAQVADAAAYEPGRPYYRLPDVRLRGLLHLLRDDERVQTYVERELGPLLAYDSRHGTDLVGLLRTYLDHGRNKSAGADAAHLSRPSFYERLHKVERILSVDLDSVESCLSLHVALLALDALRRPPLSAGESRAARRADPGSRPRA